MKNYFLIFPLLLLLLLISPSFALLPQYEGLELGYKKLIFSAHQKNLTYYKRDFDELRKQAQALGATTLDKAIETYINSLTTGSYNDFDYRAYQTKNIDFFKGKRWEEASGTTAITAFLGNDNFLVTPTKTAVNFALTNPEFITFDNGYRWTRSGENTFLWKGITYGRSKTPAMGAPFKTSSRRSSTLVPPTTAEREAEKEAALLESLYSEFKSLQQEITTKSLQIANKRYTDILIQQGRVWSTNKQNTDVQWAKDRIKEISIVHMNSAIKAPKNYLLGEWASPSIGITVTEDKLTFTHVLKSPANYLTTSLLGTWELSYKSPLGYVMIFTRSTPKELGKISTTLTLPITRIDNNLILVFPLESIVLTSGSFVEPKKK